MSTGVADILGELDRRGVALRVVGDRIRYRPVDAVPPDLRERMTAHKAELLRALRDADGTVPTATITPDDLPGPWRERYEERAAIMEYDANMTRADAEAFALADIVRLMRAAGDDAKMGA